MAGDVLRSWGYWVMGSNAGAELWWSSRFCDAGEGCDQAPVESVSRLEYLILVRWTLDPLPLCMSVGIDGRRQCRQCQRGGYHSSQPRDSTEFRQVRQVFGCGSARQ